jgi:hypothetical protein
MELATTNIKPNTAIARKVTNADELSRKIMSVASAPGECAAPHKERLQGERYLLQ